MAHQKNETLEKLKALQEKIVQAEREEERLQKEVDELAEAALDCWTEQIAQAEREEEELQEEVQALSEATLDCWTEQIAQAEREEEELKKEVDELAEAALDCWTEQIAQAEREEEKLQKEVQALAEAELDCWTEQIAQAEKEEEELQKEVDELAEAELDCWTEQIAQAEKEEEELQKEVQELAEAELDCWTEQITQAEREEEELQKEVQELAEATLDCWIEQIAQAEREEKELQKEVQELEQAEKECWEKEGIGRRPDAEPTGLPKPKLTVREPISPPKPKLIAHEPIGERIGPPKPAFPERIGSSLAKVGWKEVLIAVVVTIPLIIGAERVWKHIKQPPSVVTPAREGEGEPVKLVTVTPATPEEVVSEAVGPTDTPTPTPTPTSTPTPTPEKEKVVTPTPTPTSTPTPMPEKVQPPCDPDAAFVADVTVPDGAIFGPGECFDKIWRLRNSGGCIWEVGYTLTFISGDQMGAPDAQPVPLTMPGDTTDISATMCAPEEPGTYRSGWRMRDASGQTFGPDVYVEIVVPDPALAKKHVEEAIDLFEQGKSLLEMHDKTGEGDCTLGIELVRSAIEKCNTALGFDPTNPDAYFYRGMSRITLGDNLNEAIKEIEHALDIGLGDDKKDEAKKVVEEVREILETPINVHIDPIMFALNWKERKPVDPGPKFSGCVTKVEARWTQSNANDEKELVIWSFNGEAVCQHSNVAKRDNDWDGSNWFEDAGVCMQSGNWCAEVRISGKEVAKGCFEID